MLRPKSIQDLEVGSRWIYCNIVGNPVTYSSSNISNMVIENVTGEFLYFKFLQSGFQKTISTSITPSRLNPFLIRLIKYPSLEVKNINRVIRLLKTLSILSSIEFNKEILPILC